jgi:hypothetical protein
MGAIAHAAMLNSSVKMATDLNMLSNNSFKPKPLRGSA